jgi:hypothetical protein
LVGLGFEKGTNVTIIRVGTTQKYADGWTSAFSGKKAAASGGQSKKAASKSAAAKSGKIKAAAAPAKKAKAPAKKKTPKR